MVWGFWNRAASVKLCNVMNVDTRNIIRQAHETLEPRQSQPEVGPGFDFTMGTAAGQALLDKSLTALISDVVDRHD
jgi:hypothetical protein